MFKDVSVEQCTHDLALQATILYYQQHDISVDESNAWDFVMKYRSLLKPIRNCVEEGRTDFQ